MKKAVTKRYMRLARIFREKRLQMKLTYKEVGKRAGVDWQSVRRFEHCELVHTVHFVERVSKVLYIQISGRKALKKPDPFNSLKKSKLEVLVARSRAKVGLFEDDASVLVIKKREELGLSQDQMARILGCSDAAISYIENRKYNSKGKSKLPKDFVHKFEEVFGVRIRKGL